MKSEPRTVKTDVAAFHPFGWIEYVKHDQIEGALSRERVIPDSKKGENKHTGYLSKQACKNLKRALNMMIHLDKLQSEGRQFKSWVYNTKIGLITLTLPSEQVHTDNFIKKEILGRFFDMLRLDHSIEKYVWKAEAQANGNLHFHIALDKYIPWRKVRDMWNLHLSHYGYIDAYRNNQLAKYPNGFQLRDDVLWVHPKTKKLCTAPPAIQRQRYNKAKADNWTNPNTSDVHKVESIRDLGGYIAEYMSKKDESRRPIEGCIWSCSMCLKNTAMRIEIRDDMVPEMTYIKEKKAKMVFSDAHCKVFVWLDPLFDDWPTLLCEKWVTHIKRLMSNQSSLSIY